MTFLKPEEERALLDALAERQFYSIDAAKGPVTPGELRFFDAAEQVLIDPARISRIVDGPRQVGDDILFDVCFGGAKTLSFRARDAAFDADAAVDASDIFTRYKETARQKFFREADEGTVIADAMGQRRDRHRAVLNDFAHALAAQAPQLYEVENTRFAYFTRPRDIEEVFVFLQQTDSARITYKNSAGMLYGMPLTDAVHFKSPEDAVAGAEKLRQKMAGHPAAPRQQPPKP